MKKIARLAFLAASVLVLSCNANKEKTEDREEKTVRKEEEANERENETSPADSDSDIQKAAIGYCACFNESYGDIDPKIKRIVITAGKSDNPTYVLQRELMKIANEEEQQRIASEMERFSDDRGMQSCAQKITRKYKLDENDTKTQRQLMSELEDNEDCELVAALMKIGMRQEETENR